MIANLREVKIKWGGFGNKTCIVTVDENCCPINEPRCYPDSKWYSHKFNAAGVCYELAIAIHRQAPVWLTGPFPASMHDMTIFRSGLMAMILPGKRATADSAYVGEPDKVSITHPGSGEDEKKFFKRSKSRQEIFVNGQLNNFRVLQLPFRHTHNRHKQTMEACCVCIQFEIENENPSFEV